MRPHRPDKIDMIMGRMSVAQGRQKLSGVTIDLPNPGNKLLMYIGTPTHSEQQRERCEEMVSRIYRFNLPVDWYLVQEQVGRYKVVARQKGSDKFIAITNPGNPIELSEVIG